MSWSLAIQNGDLSFNGHQMNMVTDGQKLVQDLAGAILEPMGTDDMHPEFGSTIDGGVEPDGTYQAGVIGKPNDAVTASLVDAEIRRINRDYQTRQVARYSSDIAVYGRATLSPAEMLLVTESIGIQTAGDEMLVNIELETGTGGLSIDVPLSSSV